MTTSKIAVCTYRCNCCPATAVTESDYGERPKGWVTIDYGPESGQEWHLCPGCWAKLLAFPAFPAIHRNATKLARVR